MPDSESEETVTSRRCPGLRGPPEVSRDRESTEPLEDPSEDPSSDGFPGRGVSPSGPLSSFRGIAPTESRVSPAVAAVTAAVVPPLAPAMFMQYVGLLDSLIPSLDIVPPAQPIPVTPTVTPVPMRSVIPEVAPAPVTAPVTSVPGAAGPTVPFQLYADLSRDYDVLQGRAQQLSLMYDRLLDRTGRVARDERPAQAIVVRLRAIEEITQRHLDDLPSSSRGTLDPCLLHDILDDMMGEIRTVIVRGGQ